MNVLVVRVNMSIPVFMIFRVVDEQSYYVTSELSYSDAEITVQNLNLTKGANTSFYIVQGYRYG
jgi:hypothetical protein